MMLTAWRKKREDNEKGFTLVELIIVLAILAVIGGLAVPKFGTVLSDSKSKANDTNKTMILNALDVYQMNEGKADSDTVPTIATLVSDKYLKGPSPIKNPANDKYYKLTGTFSSPTLADDDAAGN